MKKFGQVLLNHPGLILTTWFIFVMFSVIVLPAVSFQSIQEGVQPSIDTNFSFDPSIIYPIVAGYGESGRQYYIWQRWTFDLVWPVIYTLPLWLTIRRLITDLGWHRLSFLVLTPLLAMSLDYLENIVFTILVGLYPTPIALLPFLGVGFSFLKWVFLTFSMGLTLFLCITRFIEYVRKIFRPKSF
jgi:hypothetical protein